MSRPVIYKYIHSYFVYYNSRPLPMNVGIAILYWVVTTDCMQVDQWQLGAMQTIRDMPKRENQSINT